MLEGIQNKFSMGWLEDKEVIPLRCGCEFQAASGSVLQTVSGKKTLMLIDVKSIRPSCFVLIVDHACPLAIIVDQFRWRNILIVSGSPFR